MNQSLRGGTRIGTLACLVALSLLLLTGCPPGGLTGNAILEFINNTSLTCTAFYASPSSSSSWGGNVITTSVPPNGSRLITGIPANTSYDFRADFADGSRATVGGAVFGDAQTLTWTVTDDDLTTGNAVDPAILQLEQDAFDGVNDERTSRNIPALSMREDLCAVARAHSEDMVARDFFDHVNPDGDTPFDRMGDAGIAYNFAGENLAGINNSANPVEAAVSGWMNSDGHRANILNGLYSQSGMGVASDGDGGYYFTQVFIGFSKNGVQPTIVQLHLPKPLAFSE